MLGWPWKRFEKFYEAFARRKIVEELTQRKLLTISSFYSNPNYDSKEVNRDDMIKKLEAQFAELIDNIYLPTIDLKGAKEFEDTSNDAFFAAINVEGDHLMESK